MFNQIMNWLAHPTLLLTRIYRKYDPAKIGAGLALLWIAGVMIDIYLHQLMWAYLSGLIAFLCLVIGFLLRALFRMKDELNNAIKANQSLYEQAQGAYLEELHKSIQAMGEDIARRLTGEEESTTQNKH